MGEELEVLEVIMAGLRLLWVGLLLGVGLSQHTNVKTLTDENSQEFLQSKEYVFVKFYAPWCKHCQALAPDFVAAADFLASQGSSVVFAEVAANVERATGTTYEVASYPTLILFKNGDVLDKYEGARSRDALINFVQSKTHETFKTGL